MWGAASFLFRCARCGITGAGPAAVPPTASPSLLGGGRPPGPGGAEGRACGSPAGVGAWGGGGGGAAPPPALGPVWEGGGGGPLVPWRRLLKAGGGGGAAWQSWPRGPAIGWMVAPFPRPPLPRAGSSCRPSLGPLIPPAVVARRWPAGGGREG